MASAKFSKTKESWRNSDWINLSWKMGGKSGFLQWLRFFSRHTCFPTDLNFKAMSEEDEIYSFQHFEAFFHLEKFLMLHKMLSAYIRKRINMWRELPEQFKKNVPDLFLYCHLVLNLKRFCQILQRQFIASKILEIVSLFQRNPTIHTKSFFNGKF